jgi:hypothetical protein
MKPVVTEVINFMHELDLLEAHLDEHQHFIDRIVIVETPQTYSGMNKPLYFEDNKEMFSRFNIEHEVLPDNLHVSIPSSYGEEDRKQWFDERRNNRERQQKYIFNKYKKDCDYVCNTDVDEIWSRDCWWKIESCMEKDWCYIIPAVKRFFYFMDYGAGSSNNWRITRSDMETHVRQKGMPRGATTRVGWHFTSCYNDPIDMWMKGVGLAQSVGCLGWANVPTPLMCKEMMENNVLPFVNQRLDDGVREIMPKDDLSWLPPFMAANPELWAWLPEKYREDREVSEWRVDMPMEAT